MASTATRKTADERRVDLLAAARDEFALKGLYGASTDAIARRAGISQPYLFRLFRTKKELFLACMQQCLDEMHDGFLAAAAGLEGKDALDAIGKTYTEMLQTDPTRLQAQMQGYAASGDPEVRAVIRAGFGRLVETAERISGESPQTIAAFFATGMLLNVLAMMGELTEPDAWAERIVYACTT